MTHTPHDLAADFPEFSAKIHHLKLENPHFARLLTEYGEVNALVHRAETRIDAVSDTEEIALRHSRLRLKDQLVQALRAG